MNMFDANMRKVSDSLNNTVQLAAEYGDESLKELKQYSELAEKLCEIESLMSTHRKAITEAAREQTVEAFDRTYDAHTNKKNPYYKGHKRYKTFVQYAKPLLDPSLEGGDQQEADEDDDLIIENDDSNMIDPITKRPLEVPVRNRQCNHVYEKDVIEDMLKKNANTRCPVVGCPEPNFIQPKLLVVDRNLQQKLQRLNMNA
ncbi:E3 SUMO-protein ligase NSE2-like [Anopheles bellator]|uniref:E3 SUMO-protein ligase NSE2-like n=1 Tax=Anopheles bellator TaxID=139047 RepID=UPI00264A3060|nr:E3 SUMO-protein ligase NSE2-like [Anopheles bellator]